MASELLLPCTRFAVRLRPGRVGVPTPLEQAVLYFILSLEPSATRLYEICEFTGLGRALVMDMLVDFVNRRWITLQGDGELKVTEKARGSLETAASDNSDPQDMGSTEAAGLRLVMCYDLLGGLVGLLDRRQLRKNASGENVLPRTRSGTGDGYSDKGYPKKLDEFETDPNLHEKIHRALQSNAWSRAEASKLDMQNVHVIPEAIARPYNFAQDLFHYPAAYEISKTRRDDEGGDMLRLTYAGGASSFDQRRFARGNAAEVAKIVEESKGQTTTNFHGFVFRRASGKRTEKTTFLSPMQQLRETLAGGFDLGDSETAKDLWNDVREDLLDRYSNRLNMDRSDIVAADEMHNTLCRVVHEADRGVWISSPQVSLENPAFGAEGESLLEVIAGKTKDAEFEALITTLDVDFDGKARDRIETRLGPQRHEKWRADVRHLRSPVVLNNKGVLVFLDDSPLGDRPQQGIVATFAGGESANRGATTVREMAGFMPKDIADRLVPVLDWTPAAESGEAWQNIPEILTQVDNLLVDTGQLKDEKHRDLIVKFLNWLEKWSEHHSNAIDILVGDDVQAAAWQLIRGTPSHQPLSIGLAERQDASEARHLPELVRNRLSLQSLSEERGARTVIGLPEDAESDRDYRIVLGEVQTAFGDSPETTQMVRSNADSHMGFVAAPGGMVICNSSLLQLLPLKQRRNKGLAIGLFLHGRGAMRLGFDFAELHYPGLTEALEMSFLPQDLSPPPVAPSLFKTLIGECEREDWSRDGNRGADSAKRFTEVHSGLPGWPFVNNLVALVNALNQAAEEADTSQRGILQRLSFAFLKNAARDGLSGARSRLAALWLENRRLLPASVMADELHDDHWLSTPLVRKLAICLARRTPPHLTEDDLDALANPSQVVQVLAALLMIEMSAGGLAPQLIFLDARSGNVGALENFVASLARFRQIEPTTALDFGHIVGGQDNAKRFEEIRSRLKELTLRERERTTVKMASSVAYLHNEIHGLPNNQQNVPDPPQNTFMSILDDILRRSWDTKSKNKSISNLQALMSGEIGDLGFDLLKPVKLGEITLDAKKISDQYWTKKHKEMQQRTGAVAINVRLGGRFTQSALRTIMKLVVEELAPAVRPAMSKEQQELENAVRSFAEVESNAIPAEMEWLFEVLKERLSNTRASESLWEPSWAFPTISDSSFDTPKWQELQEQILDREFAHDAGIGDVTAWYLQQIRLPEDASDTDFSGPIYELRQILESFAPDMGEENHEEAVKAFERSATRLTDGARKRAKGYLAFLNSSQASSRSLQKLCGEIEQSARDIDEAIQIEDLDALTLSLEELLERAASALKEFNSCKSEFKSAWESKQTDEAVREQGLKVLAEPTRRGSVGNLPSLLDGYQRHRPNVRSAMLRFDARFARDYMVRNPAFEPVQAEGGPLLRLVRQIRERLADMETRVAWTGDQVASAACGFFLGCEPLEALATARLDDDIWSISLADGELAPLLRGNDSGEVHLKLPLTLPAERYLRGTANFAFDKGTTIILAPFLADGIPGRRVLRANELALAATMERNDRSLYLWSQLNRQSDEWPDEILQTENIERTVAHLLRLVRSDPVEAASGPFVAIGELPQVLARLCLAFLWGSFDDNNQGQRMLTEPQVFRICEALTQLDDDSIESLKAGDFLPLLAKLKR